MTLSRPTPEYLSVEELEAYTGVSASTWNKRRVSGDTPPFCKIGRLVKYRRSDVDAWLQARRLGSTSEALRHLQRAGAGEPSDRR